MRSHITLYGLLTIAGLTAFTFSANISYAQREQGGPLLSISALRRQIAFDERIIQEFPNSQLAASLEDQLGILEQQLTELTLRAYPRDTLNYPAYLTALKHISRMPQLPYLPAIYPLSLTAWSSLGPHDLQPPFLLYNGPGPITGRVNKVAFDPTHSGYLYLASPGGVWKSTNGGSNWIPLSDKWPSTNTNSIAIDKAGNVYAGTGDLYGGIPFGLMKSTNGGLTWTNLGLSAFGFNSVQNILVDPDNNSIITVGTGFPYYGNVYRSTDGGTTWTQVISQNGIYYDVEASAKHINGTRWYYAVGSWGGGFWRSADRGASWTQLSPPVTFNSNSGGGYYIAPSEVNPDTVYLFSGTDQEVIVSSDAGNTWTQLSNNGLPSGAWGQSWYDFYIKCSTKPSLHGPVDLLYMGLFDVYQYTGSGWQSIVHAYLGNDLAHTDQHGIAFNPTNPNVSLLGNDGGIYRLIYYPSTNKWTVTSLNAGLSITQFYGTAFSHSDFKWALGGCQDNGMVTSNVGGPGHSNIAKWYGVESGDGGQCAINPLNQAIQYMGDDGGSVFQTTNYFGTGGNPAGNINYIGPNYTSGESTNFYGVLTEDQTNPQYLYTASDHLYRWNNNTQTWTNDLGGQKLAGNSTTVDYIAVAPHDSSRIYTASQDGEVWMSRNSGSTWKQITGSLPVESVTSISVSVSNENDILVTLGGTGTHKGHLFHCANTIAAIVSWTNVSGSGVGALPDVTAFSVDRLPTDPAHTFYIGTDIGVFATTNGGASWTSMNVYGLPDITVRQVNVVTGTGAEAGHVTLDATTYGRGIWQLLLH